MGIVLLLNIVAFKGIPYRGNLNSDYVTSHIITRADAISSRTRDVVMTVFVTARTHLHVKDSHYSAVRTSMVRLHVPPALCYVS
jgi:hypothetical protein